MYWYVTVAIVLLLLIIIEFALRTNEAQILVPNVGYGSDTDEDFERDKTAFNISKKIFSSDAKNWSKTKFNFNSPTLNFEDGWRVTTDSPNNSSNRGFIFGGSTVLCVEVRDSETLTSYIQRELNVISPFFRIVNRGISGATVAGGLTSFVDTEIDPNDVVIVYFGVNDAKLNEYCQKSRGIFSLIPGWISILGFLRIKLKIRIAQWIWLETVHLDEQQQRKISQNRAIKLMQNLDSWESKVRIRGATFVAILQPHIWLKQRSEAEVALSNRVAAATSTVLHFQYEAFHHILGGRKYFRSFESSLDGAHETTFTDWAHTNKRGNKIIAKKFAKEILAAIDV